MARWIASSSRRRARWRSPSKPPGRASPRHSASCPAFAGSSPDARQTVGSQSRSPRTAARTSGPRSSASPSPAAGRCMSCTRSAPVSSSCSASSRAATRPTHERHRDDRPARAPRAVRSPHRVHPAGRVHRRERLPVLSGGRDVRRGVAAADARPAAVAPLVPRARRDDARPRRGPSQWHARGRAGPAHHGARAAARQVRRSGAVPPHSARPHPDTPDRPRPGSPSRARDAGGTVRRGRAADRRARRRGHLGLERHAEPDHRLHPRRRGDVRAGPGRARSLDRRASPRLGAIAASLGVLSHFTGIDRGVIDLRDAVYFLTLAAIFLLLAYFALMRRKLTARGASLQRLRLGTALLAAAMIVVNLLGRHIGGRLDLTPGRSYTLAPATKRILGALPDIVTIKLFASSALPPEVAFLKRDLDDLLRDYRAAGRGRVKLVVQDPSADSAALREARTLGIPAVQFNVLGKSELQVKEGYLGVAVRYADGVKTIPFVQQTNDLEYRLTPDTRSLTTTAKPAIGFGELTEQQTPPQARRSFDALRQQLERTYTVRSSCCRSASKD